MHVVYGDGHRSVCSNCLIGVGGTQE
jgi:hypothetical protein